MTGNLNSLRKLPLFQGLTFAELNALKEHLTLRHAPAGSTLFTEGEAARSCFVIVEGEIDVVTHVERRGDEKLATLGPGALVGHMALVDHRPRSATCRVGVRPARLIELQRAEFEHLLNTNSPFAFKILERVALDLVGRLREATARLGRKARSRGDRHQRALDAAAALLGQGDSSVSTDEIDPDSIEVYIPSLEERMSGRRKP